ncbi:hypothetical protein AVEN_204462-1 [Araneus ventricosus]|uniref:Uncharacterized protein n=1 Tax=Araneus ventricosus TaxID=182803 RepID=A0A4Y2NPC8_ARAVE|nr:hypothetical protein AVEN_204462-1 [Araneus ventricosus]
MFGFALDIPRVYKGFGARKYMDYSPEILEACLNVISKCECALKDAEVVFDMPKRIVPYKRRQLHVRKPGRILVSFIEEGKAVAFRIV